MKRRSTRAGRRIVAVLVMGLAALTAGCARQAEAEDDGRLKVAASLFPYYDFARQIGGDRIDLSLVVPAGMDSHSFEPTPADMRLIQEADVLICNGGEMENWLRQVLDALDAPDLQVVTMMDYVDAVEEELVEGMEDADDHGEADGGKDDGGGDASGENDGGKDDGGGDASGENDDGKDDSGENDGGEDEHDHDHDHELDEHIWTSVRNAEVFAGVIGETLAEADEENRAFYETQADAYVKQLEILDQKFTQMTEESSGRMIVVADKFPFRYLADDYGLSYRAAFSGCSSDSEPSARTIAYLIDLVDEQQIPAVYYLELKTPRVAEIIGEETGAEPLLLHSCHNVTRKELEDGVTYLELMERNVENLRKGLNGWKR